MKPYVLPTLAIATVFLFMAPTGAAASWTVQATAPVGAFWAMASGQPEELGQCLANTIVGSHAGGLGFRFRSSCNRPLDFTAAECKVTQDWANRTRFECRREQGDNGTRTWSYAAAVPSWETQSPLEPTRAYTIAAASGVSTHDHWQFWSIRGEGTFTATFASA